MKTKINLLGAVVSLLAILGPARSAAAATTLPRIVFAGAVTDRKTQRTTYPILSINGDGSGVAQLTKRSGGFPCWNHDQKFVAYSYSSTAENTIYVLEIKTGREFAAVQAAPTGHDWSRDDTKLLYTGIDAIGNGLWIAGINLTAGTVGTPTLIWPGPCFDPKFSPDGTKIAYYTGGQTRVLDLSTQTEITIPGSDISANWSPDGTKIVFSGTVCYGSVWNCYPEIIIANADGTDRTPITRLQSQSYFPTWSQDGTQIAFCSNVTGSKALWKITIASGTVTLLYDKAFPGIDW
jgi:Tol biopolymer transport system component